MTQPAPIKNRHPLIVGMVVQDLCGRSQKGIETYGTPLQPHNGRDALADLYEELLDACQYLRQVIYERDNPRSGE